MTRRVTTTRRNAARDMTKAMRHAAAEPATGRHRSLPAASATSVPAPHTPHRVRSRRTMPGM